MAKELSEGLRGQIIALSNEGYSQQIAKKIMVSKGAFQQTLQRFRETGRYSTTPRSGRPRVTTSNEDQLLWEHVKRENVKRNPTSLNNLWDVLNHCWN